MLTFLILFTDDFISYFQGGLRLWHVVPRLLHPNNYLLIEYFPMHQSSNPQNPTEDWPFPPGWASVQCWLMTLPHDWFTSFIPHYPYFPPSKNTVSIYKPNKHINKTHDKIREYISQSPFQVTIPLRSPCFHATYWLLAMQLPPSPLWEVLLQKAPVTFPTIPFSQLEHLLCPFYSLGFNVSVFSWLSEFSDHVFCSYFRVPLLIPAPWCEVVSKSSVSTILSLWKLSLIQSQPFFSQETITSWVYLSSYHLFKFCKS